LKAAKQPLAGASILLVRMHHLLPLNF